jgi:hypothetical protein
MTKEEELMLPGSIPQLIADLESSFKELDEIKKKFEKTHSNPSKEFKSVIDKSKLTFKCIKSELKADSNIDQKYLQAVKSIGERLNSEIFYFNTLTKPSPKLDEMKSEEIIEMASMKQQETDKVLDRILIITEEAKNIGINIADQLALQSEKLQKVAVNIEELQQVDLKTANTQIRSYARKLSQDKLLIGLILLIIISSIVFVIITLVQKK